MFAFDTHLDKTKCSMRAHWLDEKTRRKENIGDGFFVLTIATTNYQTLSCKKGLMKFKIVNNLELTNKFYLHVIFQCTQFCFSRSLFQVEFCLWGETNIH